jgi:DNA-binding NarL/FixJ family response regulator
MSTTILIVDDSAQFRALMREILAQEPAFLVVGEAADGAEALALAQALQPDMVLLDLAMPRVSGLEALPRLKAACPATRVIVVTVHVEDAYHQAAAARGADALLLKKTLGTTLLPTLRDLRQALAGPA